MPEPSPRSLRRKRVNCPLNPRIETEANPVTERPGDSPTVSATNAAGGSVAPFAQGVLARVGHDDYRKLSRLPASTGGPQLPQVSPGIVGAWVARDACDSRGALGVSSFYGA